MLDFKIKNQCDSILMFNESKMLVEMVTYGLAVPCSTSPIYATRVGRGRVEMEELHPSSIRPT